jgi:predicted transcriptional regulator
MKTIVLSVQPKWLEKILNGEKTVEIRKTYPKIDEDVKVLLYCTKGKPYLRTGIYHNERFVELVKGWKYWDAVNGLIVGEFTLKTAYLVLNQGSQFYIHDDDKYLVNKIARESCLDYKDMKDYAKDKDVYAWKIDNLKIYDNPKTLQDYGLTRAPQSWCYVK